MRLHAMRPGAVLLVSLLLIPQAVSAQNRQTRHGFWLSAGPGYGTTTISCPGDASALGCARSGAEAMTLFVAGGTTLSPHFLIGAQLTGISIGSNLALRAPLQVDPILNPPTKPFDSPSVVFTTLDFTAAYYPVVSSGFFVRGGAGLANARVTHGGDSETGWSLLGGVGYDLRVTRNVSVTPQATFALGRIHGFENAITGAATRWHQRMFTVGMALTLH
ncbi:MAG TPA: hypothetical protein VFL95_11680 [Gemmatimonadales bacterium]|nr:hypothetical protein [Gemmatimonadales bacterium]